MKEEDKPKKDFVKWLEEDGLPATKSILAELKAINKKEEDIEVLAEQDRLATGWDEFDSKLPYNSGFIRGYKAASKEEVSWKEVEKFIAEDLGESIIDENVAESDPHNWWLRDLTVDDLVDWLKENYILTKK